MRRNFSRLILVMVIGILFAYWTDLPTLAQGGGPKSPLYDPATEVTMRGSVEAVKQIRGPQNWGGTHLTLKTDKETLDVHVGPSWFLTQEKVNFVKGDQVEVTGSRVKFENHDALLAREIKKNGQTITLRNSQGIPVWSRGRGRRPS